ncbi:energy transducer TonB [Massilia sp. CCM 8734]|uniref:energy transducer TonB n=1 Tax=Massilia sp. CCM 8734 TaxID=2609283 RepID=UPI001421D650|nr:energy transducer TonB [Massilia sp. CCM 8734]NHZ95558.1 TonB family protein [Massilia sp. CCM 8734]
MTRLSFADLGRLIVLAGALGSLSGHAHAWDRADQSGLPIGAAQAADAAAYPLSSLRAKHQGNVTISFLITVDGNVVDSRTVKSSGHALRDMTAVKALSLCRFKPAIGDGKAVGAWTNVQYGWTLT